MLCHENDTKIDTINCILNEYFEVFGREGYEYNNLLTDVMKIIGSEFEQIILYGSDSSPACISKQIASTNSKELECRLTILVDYLSSKPSASEIAREVYGVDIVIQQNIQAIKVISSVKRLVDFLPNYSSLDNITNFETPMEFNEIEGQKIFSKEYIEMYEKLGNEIEEYLMKVSRQGKEIIDELKKENPDKTKPVTIADLLKNK